MCCTSAVAVVFIILILVPFCHSSSSFSAKWQHKNYVLRIYYEYIHLCGRARKIRRKTRNNTMRRNEERKLHWSNNTTVYAVQVLALSRWREWERVEIAFSYTHTHSFPSLLSPHRSIGHTDIRSPKSFSVGILESSCCQYYRQQYYLVSSHFVRSHVHSTLLHLFGSSFFLLLVELFMDLLLSFT